MSANAVSGTSYAVEAERSAKDWRRKKKYRFSCHSPLFVDTLDTGDLLIMAPILGPILNYLYTLAGASAPAEADADLLRRFTECQDQSAVTAILLRHGPTVRAVCCRVPGNDRSIHSIPFLPGSNGLVTSVADGTILIWTLLTPGAAITSTWRGTGADGSSPEKVLHVR
jgi:hypothetical protein